MEVIGAVDVTAERAKRAAKWAEVVRIATQAANAIEPADRYLYAADLLAELGVIHSTPDAKRAWADVWGRQ